MQWERAELFNQLVTEFLSPTHDWRWSRPTFFGKFHLGYLVIENSEVRQIGGRFGRDAIGMHLDETLPDVLRFRLDDNECRFLLQRGPAEDTTALGWELDDHATFDTIEKRIRDRGVPSCRAAMRTPALRGVERFIRFPGPNGLAQRCTCAATPRRSR